MENKEVNILESHRKNRKCMNSQCINNSQIEDTTRFTCWYCGCSLEVVTA